MSEQQFYPGQPVLVRDLLKDEEFPPFMPRNRNKWEYTLYGRYCEEEKCPHITVSGYFRYCIPYDGNEHLHGTSEDIAPTEPEDEHKYTR